MEPESADLPRGMYRVPFDLERPSGASQTLLSHLDACPYSAALYMKHKGGAQTPPLARGEAFHDFAERFTNLLIENDEPEAPPDIAKDLMAAVLEERVDLAIPVEEHDALRAMSWNFASATRINPETIAGVELGLSLEIGGWTLRGRLDLLLRGDGFCTVRDYKTSLALPSVEDYEQSFQPPTYALLAMEGVPEGATTPIARGLDFVRTEAVFPRYHREGEGDMATRWAEFDRARVADHKRTIEALLRKLDHGLETGEWAASESSHCQICPARGECPIPREYRKIRAIGTQGDAREVAGHVAALEDELKGEKAALRAWCGENGKLVIGDEEWTFTLEQRETANKADVKGALVAAGQDPEAFYKTSSSTRFGKKRIKKAAA